MGLVSNKIGLGSNKVGFGRNRIGLGSNKSAQKMLKQRTVKKINAKYLSKIFFDNFF